MNEQAKLFLPPNLAKKQMVPTSVALAGMERALKKQRNQALLLFRKILETTDSTKEQLIKAIDDLLQENQMNG